MSLDRNTGKPEYLQKAQTDTVGRWLADNDLVDERSYNSAVLWPKDFAYAREMSSAVDNMVVLGDEDNGDLFDSLPGVVSYTGRTHDYIEEVQTSVDLEVGWAVASDIVGGINEEDLTLTESMERTAYASDELRKDNGAVVYNTEYLETHSQLAGRGDSDRTNLEQFAEVLEDTVADEVEVIKNPSYRRASNQSHIIWQ